MLSEIVAEGFEPSRVAPYTNQECGFPRATFWAVAHPRARRR